MSEKSRSIRVGYRRIGPGSPAFVIAEIGSNHDGDLEKAKRYIDEAAKIGADAVKFQSINLDTFLADLVVIDGQLIPNEMKAQAKFIPVSETWYPELFDYARIQGLVAFATPFDLSTVSMLVDAGAEVMKIASGDVTNPELIKEIGRTGKPVLMSTGMANLGEVERALQALYSTGNDQVVLLHCVSTYPTVFEDVNLKAMQTLHAAFHVPVGLSDHTPGPETAVGAIGLGACVIEKHITFDRTSPGTDHFFAMEIPEFDQMIQMIRHVETAMGTGEKYPSEREQARMAKVRRALYTTRPIATGEIFEARDLIAMRPQSDYIKADRFDSVVGLKAPRDYKKGQPLRWADFVGQE
ncbi:MAG: N-acetylneuraminate synthase family protein [bacterium]